MNKIKFPKETRTKWLEALRSGDYKQGQIYLRNKENEFCCLGVLCDILGAEWDIGPYSGGYKPNDADMCVITEQAVGYDINCALEKDIAFKDNHMSLGTILIEMNDNMKEDFTKIADFIELTTEPV